jgi:hypothetical protein
MPHITISYRRADGGSIGVYAGSEEAAESEWRFVDITVVEGE